MERADYLAAFRAESDRFLAAARRGLAGRVPGCPDWTTGDLVNHLGRVYTFVAGIAGGSVTDTGAVREIAERADREAADRQARGVTAEPAILDWFAESRDRLGAVLDRIDPAAGCWTMSPRHRTGAFWIRRMAQETAVHRWDAQSAHGPAEPIDRPVAIDGIDEMIDIFVPRRRRGSQTEARGESYLIAPTDAPERWTIRIEGDQVHLDRGSETAADLRLAGPASDLLLFLWQRVPADRLTVAGDPALVDRYFELVPPN